MEHLYMPYPYPAVHGQNQPELRYLDKLKMNSNESSLNIAQALTNNFASFNLNDLPRLKKDIANVPEFTPRNITSSASYSPKNNKVIGDSMLEKSELLNSYFPEFIPNATPEFVPRTTLGQTCSVVDTTTAGQFGNEAYGIPQTTEPESFAVPTFQDLSVSVPEFIPRIAKSYTSNVATVDGVATPLVSDSLQISATQNATKSPFPTGSVEVQDDDNSANIATYQENVNGTVYFYTAPLAQPTTSVVDTSLAEQTPDTSIQISKVTPVDVYSSDTQITTNAATSYLVADELNNDMYVKGEMVMMHPGSGIYTPLPSVVGEYGELIPLEPVPFLSSSSLPGYITSMYKAVHIKSGVPYCLRRIHNTCLTSVKCNGLVNTWKKLSHSNLVHLNDMFVTTHFSDNSIVFVYDYYEDYDSLLTKHFSSQLEGFNGYTDTFSSDPNAPRPYSHTKNALLRQQHSNMTISERTLWSYVIQITGALRVIHAAGLSCRCIDPTKIIISKHNRVRIGGIAVSDVVLFDHSPTNRKTLTFHFQQEDLSALGKLLLALACGSLIAIQRENLQTSLEVMSRTYSKEIKNLIMYLLTPGRKRNVLDLIPMIGAKFYSAIDTMQLQCDELENKILNEMNSKRLLRLVVKLACINENPDLSVDAVKSGETNDRYLLMLFRDYLYHQTTEDQRPWINMAHIIQNLCKMDSGSAEKVCLLPSTETEENIALETSYEEIKQSFERSFNELSDNAVFEDEEAEDVTDIT